MTTSPSQHKLNHGRLSATVTPFGASLASLSFNHQQVLRRIPIDLYPTTSGHFGSVAGPIANRIGGAEVTINGRMYQLPKNDGDNTLHGGPLGLGRREWSLEASNDRSVSLVIKLADRELGLPGERVFRCRYELSEEAELSSLTIKLTMISSEDTLCNLAPHPYFCLDDSGSILDHELTLLADHYLPTNEQCLPKGEVTPVESSRFDLRQPSLLRTLADQGELNFDHNFCFPKPSRSEPVGLQEMATLYSPHSRVKMSLHSNQRGLQVYTPKELGDPTVDRQRGDLGSRLIFEAICLEPQSWPDGPNHKTFPSIFVERGEAYEHITRLDFSHPTTRTY